MSLLARDSAAARARGRRCHLRCLSTGTLQMIAGQKDELVAFTRFVLPDHSNALQVVPDFVHPTSCVISQPCSGKAMKAHYVVPMGSHMNLAHESCKNCVCWNLHGPSFMDSS